MRKSVTTAAKQPVLSLMTEAAQQTPMRRRSSFEVLVRHLLHRFLHHELLASDDETKRVLQIAYALALPTVVVSLFLFPAYHAYPPLPHPRPFWSQVGDHYIFVVYSFVIMGIATVYEWDLLFPDLLDVYVLSVLPIRMRTLFAARVLAVLVFLATALLGTSGLGVIFFPLFADLPSPWHHLLSHALAVFASGSFAAISFLALQGALLNVLGERVFRRFGPLIQGLALMALLATLLLTPTVIHDVRALLTASSPAVRWFPPFWYLGVYECVLHGRSAPDLFFLFAGRGLWALLMTTTCMCVTYPLAYRRRVRQLVEGEVATSAKRSSTWPYRLMHRTWLPLPAHRATFHLASQTVLRKQRHRVMLALYGGLALALVLANMLVLRINLGRIRPALLITGIRAAMPITILLTVVALRNATWAPVDHRGSWIYRSILGRPRPEHLVGTKRWVLFWAVLLGTVMWALLYPLSPPALHTVQVVCDQGILCIGLAVLLTDVCLLSRQKFPFTDLKISSITDMPLAVFRNFVLFPALLAVLVALEPGFERSWSHLAKLAAFFAIAAVLVKRWYARSLDHLNADVLVADEDVFPQGLGLRDG